MKPQTNDFLRQSYKDSWVHDEAWRHLYRALGYKQMLARFGYAFRHLPDQNALVDAHDVHHIHGGYTGRWDLWSELISLSRPVHEWVENHPVEGRVVCLYAKWRKSKSANAEDFDQGELSQASGKTYPQVIQTYDVTGEFKKMRNEMVKGFRL